MLRKIPLFIGLAIFFLSSKASSAETVGSFSHLLNQHQGKVIYLDFWASWCAPCRKSFPWMNAIQAKYEKNGFIVIGVNVDNNQSLAETFLKETPAEFVLFYDPKGRVARQYKVRGMPSSYLLDRAGNVISRHAGFNAKKATTFEQEIIALLKK